MGFHFVFLGDSANVTLSCVNILPGLDISSSLVSLLPLLTSHSMPKCMSIPASSSSYCTSYWSYMWHTDSATDAKLASLSWRLSERCYIKPPIWWDYNYRYLIWRHIFTASLCCLIQSSRLLQWQWPALAEIRWESWSRRWHRRKVIWLHGGKIWRRGLRDKF